MSNIVMCTALFSEIGAILSDLHASGFSSHDISILVKDKADYQDPVVRQITKTSERDDAGTGTVDGSPCGTLTGIGTLVNSEPGPLIALGPIIAALRRVSLAGTTSRLSDTFISLGVPEVLAVRYEQRLSSGAALIGVLTDKHEDATCARDIFEYAEAEDISSTDEGAAEDCHRRADRVGRFMRMESPSPWLL